MFYWSITVLILLILRHIIFTQITLLFISTLLLHFKIFCIIYIPEASSSSKFIIFIEYECFITNIKFWIISMFIPAALFTHWNFLQLFYINRHPSHAPKSVVVFFFKLFSRLWRFLKYQYLQKIILAISIYFSVIRWCKTALIVWKINENPTCN